MSLKARILSLLVTLAALVALVPSATATVNLQVSDNLVSGETISTAKNTWVATANEPVLNIKFYVDNVLIDTESNPPLETCVYRSGTPATNCGSTQAYAVANGTHNLKVVATHATDGTTSTKTTSVNFAATPVVSAPSASTSSATGLSHTGATLNASVDPNNGSTSVTFEYGTTTAYGSTATATTQTGDGARNVSVNVGSLTDTTTYHYRVVAVNSAGTATGANASFQTWTHAVNAVTTAESSVGQTQFTANGTVDPNNNTTTSLRFEWGTTTAYGNTVTLANKSGDGAQAVSSTITGLTAGTTYHYRLVAVNGSYVSEGADETVTTSSVPTGTLKFSDNFNDLDRDSADWELTASDGYTETYDTVNKVEGAGAVKFSIPAVTSRSSFRRNELQAHHADNGGFTWRIAPSQLLYWGWDMKLDANYPINNTGGATGFNVLKQWKDAGPGAGSPPLTLAIEDGALILDGGQDCPENPGGGSKYQAVIDSTVDRNVWDRYTFKVWLATAANGGYVEVWRNGTPVTFAAGSNYTLQNSGTRLLPECGTTYTAPSTTYTMDRIGIYRGGGITGAATVWYDNYKIGTTYEIVQP